MAKNNNNYINYIGKTIGDLTIESVSKSSNSRGQYRFNCVCSCGRKVSRDAIYIVNCINKYGLSPNCGCKKYIHRSIYETYKSYVGKKYGSITVIDVYSESNGHKNNKIAKRYKFLLKCDCGYEFRCYASEFLKESNLKCPQCEAKSSINSDSDIIQPNLPIQPDLPEESASIPESIIAKTNIEFLDVLKEHDPVYFLQHLPLDQEMYNWLEDIAEKYNTTRRHLILSLLRFMMKKTMSGVTQ